MFGTEYYRCDGKTSELNGYIINRHVRQGLTKENAITYHLNNAYLIGGQKWLVQTTNNTARERINIIRGPKRVVHP